MLSATQSKEKKMSDGKEGETTSKNGRNESSVGGDSTGRNEPVVTSLKGNGTNGIVVVK